MRAAEEAIVLVGGLGTRLRSEIADLPKPLAPVAGRPFLAYVLDALAAGGLRRTILATGYRSEMVETAIGRQWLGMEVVYSVEDQPLGTGGAIARAARLLQADGVHVANGDTFLRFNLQALEQRVAEARARIGMAVAFVPDVARYGAIGIEGGRASTFCEKGGQGPGAINAGSYFLTPEAIAALPDTGVYSFEERVLLPTAAQGSVAVLEETTDFIDIGVPEDYRRAQQVFAT